MAELIRVLSGDGEVGGVHWFLSDEEMMWAALKELIRGHGCRGTVMMWPDSSGGEVWQFEANDAVGTACTAQVGDHVVLVDGGGLRTYDRDLFEAVALPVEGD